MSDGGGISPGCIQAAPANVAKERIMGKSGHKFRQREQRNKNRQNKRRWLEQSTNYQKQERKAA